MGYAFFDYYSSLLLLMWCCILTLATVYHIPASHRYKVSAELALKQINRYLDRQQLDPSKYAAAFEARSARYKNWRATLDSREVILPGGPIKVPYLMSRLRKLLPQDTTIVLEAVTNALPAIEHLHLTEVGALLVSTETHTPPSSLPMLTTDDGLIARKPLRYRCGRAGLDRRRSDRRQAGQARVICLRHVRKSHCCIVFVFPRY